MLRARSGRSYRSSLIYRMLFFSLPLYLIMGAGFRLYPLYVTNITHYR